MTPRLVYEMIALFAAAGCAHYSDSGAATGGADGGPEISCPVSDSGRFDVTPTGECVGVGSCVIELDNSCRPGVSVVPTTAPVYECQCISNQWQCTVKSGGLGLTTCDDAGAPDK